MAVGLVGVGPVVVEVEVVGLGPSGYGDASWAVVVGLVVVWTSRRGG